MKWIIYVIIISASALRAQVPHIDYVIADEAKSQLQIHGTFPSDTTGFVTIENTKQTVRFWSDSMLICDLPDSGAGAGGHVIVQQTGGMSNARMLSIFEATIVNPFFYPWGTNQGYVFIPYGNSTWNVNWRADILPRPLDALNNIRFEISKSSKGLWIIQGGPPLFPDTMLAWSDSLSFKNITMTLFGEIDLNKYVVKFAPTEIQSFPNGQAEHSGGVIPFIESYQPWSLNFDTTGYFTGYQNDDTSGDPTNGTLEKHSDYLYNQKIVFPPGIKNAITLFPRSPSNFINIISHIGSEDRQIPFEAEEPLGETTASLYSIDGRLLKEEKYFIPSAGIYSFDASGINTRFGILVFKTDRGLFARKVLF